jgi:glycosyltransferase involved in cell wall biosynthesis
MALNSEHELSIEKRAVQADNEKFFGYWRRYRSVRYSEEAVHILEPYPIAFGRPNKSAMRIGIIHHIETERARKSWKYRIFYLLLMSQLKKMDLVVTVSQLWKDYLMEKGCKRVEVIYNSFNKKDYDFRHEELRAFKRYLGLDANNKLIYIGNAGNGKGVQSVYEKLRNSGYQLVMTGASNEAPELPIKFFNLEVVEYRKLIASCDVVLAMSNMMEGWNRIAHEAMLARVPVIGSGSGGMRELLEKGNQIICSDIEELNSKIIYALANKEKLGQDGYDFVKELDEEYFKKTWLMTMDKMTKMRSRR